MVTTRRILGIGDAGDSTHFGTDDVDFINQLLTGTDQSTTASVDLATNTKFRNTRCRHANPGNTFNYIVNTAAITADRNVSYPLLTADDTYLFQNASQNALAFDNFPSVSREGTVEPNGNNTAIVTGILAGTIAGAGSITSVYDTVEGMTLACATTATANLNAGYVAPSGGIGMGRRLTNLRMKSRNKIDSTASARLYMGFTSLATLPINDIPLANADSGVMIGFRSTDANYSVLNNDGTGPVVVTATSTPKDGNFHTMEIKMLAGGNVIVSLDNTVVATLSTRLPATTTNLYFNCLAQTTSGTARTFTFRYIEGEADR